MTSDRPAHLLAGGEPTLPSQWYFDPEHHARELRCIWYRSWVCVGRAEEIPAPRDYLVAEIGDQAIVVARDMDGGLRAFHNSCRHRGSALCVEARGRLPGASIVCPYHGWTYSLAGELLGARHQLPSSEFRKEDHSLHRVAVEQWAGCLFVNLAGPDAPPLSHTLGDLPDRFAKWRVEELRVAHRVATAVACNWKVFWENFSECFHCPGVHPELCRIVPVYARGLLDEVDDPETFPDARSGPPLAQGAVTWTLDGRSRLPPLPGLGHDERSLGMSFAVLRPGIFLIAHLDYVRSVRVLPRGPEQTELVVEWLLPPAILERGDLDLEHMVALGRRVVEQDTRACELNQRGLRCMRHERGVLVPQEYGVHEFQQWVREALGEAP